MDDDITKDFMTIDQRTMAPHKGQYHPAPARCKWFKIYTKDISLIMFVFQRITY